jgi:hypothetical protein
MKLFAPLVIAGGMVAALASQPALASGSVSIEIAQPGVYGRVVVGDVRPAVVYAEPVIVAPARYAEVRRPIYLYVPPGHQKNWSKHCHRYGACGQPVYFVKESWVREHHRHAHVHRLGAPAPAHHKVRHDDRRHPGPSKGRHPERRNHR